jgi:hypothetical protein
MTGALLAAAVVASVFGGWLVGIVMGRGVYGVPGDLSLGLVGGTLVVWIYQAVGLAVYGGIIGAMVAACLGAAGIVIAQRKSPYPAR